MSCDPSLAAIADPVERDDRLLRSAEAAAIDRILVAQAAAVDCRPIDSSAVEHELTQVKASGACRSGFDDGLLRQQIEANLRLRRLEAEMTANAAPVTEDEAGEFYVANADRFAMLESFQASHIICHVNEQQSEAQAEQEILSASAALERGEPFSEVADRHSDCKGQGGDLGRFDAGEMVDEFEAELRKLEPGQRSGVFTSPLGFHIVELRAKYPSGPADFGVVKNDVLRVFTLMRRHQAYLDGVRRLREKARIVTVSGKEAEGAKAQRSGGST